MKRLILQVLGRLKKGYNEVKFTVVDEDEQNEGEPVRDCLSSRALARKLENSEVALLVPESLVAEIASDENEAEELVSDRNKPLRDRIYSELRHNELLSNNENSALIMQSIGTYGEKFRVNFLNTADNVVVALIFDLLEKVHSYEEIILDVSTGHNIYVASLIDAARTLIVYLKLEKIISGEKVPKFKIAYSPPVLQSLEDVSYPIRCYDFDVKVFFDLPVKKTVKIEELLKKEKDEKNVKLRKDINTSFENERSIFSELINETIVAYNAIRYNVPLAYFDDDIISFKISEKDALSNLCNILKYIVEDKKELRKDKGEIVIKRPSVERVLFINLLLTTAFHRALREFKEGLKKESSTDVILEEFKSLYEKVGLGLNSRFLERDINEIKELFPYLGEKEETIKELKKRKLVPQLQNARENKNGKKGGDIKRNFFAHSGFEETITLIKKQNEKYCLCYKPEEKTNIKKWLENPENKKSEIKIFIAM